MPLTYGEWKEEQSSMIMFHAVWLKRRGHIKEKGIKNRDLNRANLMVRVLLFPHLPRGRRVDAEVVTLLPLD